MERFVGPFLSRLQLHIRRRTSRTQVEDAIMELQNKLGAYTGAHEGNEMSDLLAAEDLLKALYSERTLFTSIQPLAYIKILRLLWQFEEQGCFPHSSLINGLVVKALIEACYGRSCKLAAISALQNMFIISNPEDKRILVCAVIHTLYADYSDSIIEAWEVSIIQGIGESAMRMDIVESVIIEQVLNPCCINGNNSRVLITCIRSAMNSRLFNHGHLREAIWERFLDSEGTEAVAYLRFFCAIAELDEANSFHYLKACKEVLEGYGG